MRQFWLAGITFASLCAAGTPASAEELFRYNYVDVGYTKLSIDSQVSSTKIDGSTFGIIGSYAVHEMVAIQLGYDKAKASINSSALSFSSSGSDLTLGVDVHKMVTESTEVALDLARLHNSTGAFTRTEGGVAIAVPSTTDNANVFGVRVRTAIVPEFRLLASAGRTTGGAVATSNYSAGVEYEFGGNYSVGAAYGLSTASVGNTHSVGISGRYYF